MNRVLSFGSLAVLALLFLAGASQTPAVTAPQPASLQPMDVTIEIAPSYTGPYELLRQRYPETFSCTAMLADPDTHKRLGFAAVTVTPGHEASRTFTQNDLTIILQAKIGTDRDGANADLRVLRDGQLVIRQKTALLLKRTTAREHLR
ncbi:MAG: hypothetical protein QOK37_1141 [Thermoanaerobaculia bacterium]|jgi:hypothetical protein|nr:hypothetical protein [Thermoanaerobaculia bacterium]